jgi:hypothetical protein
LLNGLGFLLNGLGLGSLGRRRLVADESNANRPGGRGAGEADGDAAAPRAQERRPNVEDAAANNRLSINFN